MFIRTHQGFRLAAEVAKARAFLRTHARDSPPYAAADASWESNTSATRSSNRSSERSTTVGIVVGGNSGARDNSNGGNSSGGDSSDREEDDGGFAALLRDLLSSRSLTSCGGDSEGMDEGSDDDAASVLALPWVAAFVEKVALLFFKLFF